MQDDKQRHLASFALSSSQERTIQVAIYLSSSLSLIGISYVILHFCWQHWFAKGRRRRRPQMDFTAKLVLVLSLFDFTTILARIVGRAVIHNYVLCNIQASVLHATGLGSCLWVCCMAFYLYRWIVGGESDAKRQSRFLLFLMITLVPSIGFVVYHVATHRYGDATFYCWLKEDRFILLHFYAFYAVMVVYIIVLHALIHFNMKRRVAWHDTVEADTSSMLIRRKNLLYIVVFIVHRAPMMVYRILEALSLNSFELGLFAQIILNLDGLSNSIVYGGLCRRQVFEEQDEQLPRGRTFPADSVSSPTNESFDNFFKKRGGNAQFSDDLDLTMMTATHDETVTTTMSTVTDSTRKQQCFFSTGVDDILMRSSILNHLPQQQQLYDSHLQHKSSWSQLQNATRKASYEKLQHKRSATTMRPKKLPLFVSTFNMGEQNVNEKELPNWIPLGYQVYVIGVQECMDLADLQTKIHHHLVVGSQCKFVYYSREIGKRATALGYHGYIALTVFVRESAVLEGRFQIPYRQSSNKSAQEVFRGKSLLVFGRASNKGAVGMSFRYESTSFAFATCHLASDSSSNRLPKRKKSRESKKTPASKFERRNQDAMQILQQLYLDDEDYGFGFPLLHHHSFILGDFNYRMTRRAVNPQEMLELFTEVGRAKALAVASRQSESETSINGVDVVLPLPSSPPSVASGDETIDSPTNGNYDFQQCVTPKLEHEIQSSATQPAASLKVMLMSLVEDHDELRALLNSKQLFYGFQEPPIAFYPTFRRIRGEQLNPSDPHSFLKNFTLITSKGGYRIPSYTDRVLHSSLPGSQDMIECISYSSCESVTTSDHKPVFGIFMVTLNEPVLDQNLASTLSPGRHPLSPYAAGDDSLWTNSGGGHLNILNSATTSAVAAGRMKDVPGTCEMRLKIEFRSIHWMDAIDCQPGSTLFDRVEDIEFGFLFPIPCEDVFSQQRKLHEVAEHLTWMDSGGKGGNNGNNGNGSEFASTVTPTSNFHTIKWNNFVEGGLRYNTMAQPSGKKHVAILIRAQSRARGMSRTSSATAMLGSPFVQPSESSGASSGGSGNDMGSGRARILTTIVPTASEQILGQGTFCVDATGRKRETSISLTVGGKLLGRLQLQVALQVRRHQR